MFNRRDVVFLYDGSFYGLLSAVFECYYSHTIPNHIKPEKNVQQELLCEYINIETDISHAERVANSIVSKISYRALYNIFYAYLSELCDKEIVIFDYIRAGYKYGKLLDNHMTLDCVDKILKSEHKVRTEAHLFKGFLRFSKLRGEIYYARIKPKSNVLPELADHFVKRYRSMPFLIHDETHNQCLVYNGKECVIREVNSMPRLELSEDETEYRKMWKCFFDTIEIKERHNERCQNTMLPKWYRRNMTEFILPSE